MPTLLLLLALMSPAADSVKATEAERFRLMTANDLSGLMGYLDEDLVYIHSTGEMETKAEFLERVRSGKLRYRSIQPAAARVRTVGSVAIVTGRAKVGVTSDGADRDLEILYTSVYRKTGGRWKLLSWQSTRIP